MGEAEERGHLATDPKCTRRTDQGMLEQLQLQPASQERRA